MDRPHGLFAEGFDFESSSNEAIQPHLTLRNCCEQYRDSEGISWKTSMIPEMSGAENIDQMCPLKRFDNIVGHFHDNRYAGFNPEILETIPELLRSVSLEIGNTLRSYRLWCPTNVQEYIRTSDGSWRIRGTAYPCENSQTIETFNGAMMSPLSAHSVHAFLEAELSSALSCYRALFEYPKSNVPATGLIGTLHNNQVIDMSPHEPDGQPNSREREYRSHYLGILCAGHTAHSTEALGGKDQTCNMRCFRTIDEC